MVGLTKETSNSQQRKSTKRYVLLFNQFDGTGLFNQFDGTPSKNDFFFFQNLLVINLFHAPGLFLYPLKTSENLWFLMFSGDIE